MPRADDDRERQDLQRRLDAAELREHVRTLIADYGDDTAEALAAIQVSMARAEERLRALERDAKITREEVKAMREALSKIQGVCSAQHGEQAQAKHSSWWSWLVGTIGAFLGFKSS